MKSTVVEASNYPIPEDTLIPLKLESAQQVEVPFVYKKGPRMGQEKLAAGPSAASVQCGQSLLTRGPITGEFT